MQPSKQHLYIPAHRGRGSVKGRSSYRGHPRIVIDRSDNTDDRLYHMDFAVKLIPLVGITVQFNEPVGPTQPLPTTATAIDFLCNVL